MTAANVVLLILAAASVTYLYCYVAALIPTRFEPDSNGGVEPESPPGWVPPLGPLVLARITERADWDEALAQLVAADQHPAGR